MYQTLATHSFLSHLSSLLCVLCSSSSDIYVGGVIDKEERERDRERERQTQTN